MNDITEQEAVDYGDFDLDNEEWNDKNGELELGENTELAAAADMDDPDSQLAATGADQQTHSPTTTGAPHHTSNTQGAPFQRRSARAPMRGGKNFRWGQSMMPFLPGMMSNMPEKLPASMIPGDKHYTVVHINPQWMAQMNTMTLPMLMEQQMALQRQMADQQQMTRRQDVRSRNQDMAFATPLQGQTGHKRRLNDNGTATATAGLTLKGSARGASGVNAAGRNGAPLKKGPVPVQQAVSQEPKVAKAKVLISNIDGVSDDDIRSIAEGYDFIDLARTDQGITLTFPSDETATVFRRQRNRHKLGPKDAHILVKKIPL